MLSPNDQLVAAMAVGGPTAWLIDERGRCLRCALSPHYDMCEMAGTSNVSQLSLSGTVQCLRHAGARPAGSCFNESSRRQTGRLVAPSTGMLSKLS